MFQQLSNEAILNHQQLQVEQRLDAKASGKNGNSSSGRNRNVAAGGLPKMIDVDELPVNGRALPLSSRCITWINYESY